MKILVTGSNGFIGKNLISELKNKGFTDIYEFDVNNTSEQLNTYTKDSDFIFHLAGVNRPKEEKGYIQGNYDFTSQLLLSLEKNENKCPIVISSSIQAQLDNPYGRSKKLGEELVFDYGVKNDVEILVYRFSNVFGKWCKPNYNSVVATFSHNIANDLEIIVNDRETILQLVYIDDVVDELINALLGQPNKKEKFCIVEPVFEAKLGYIADLLKSFKSSRSTIGLSDFSDKFVKYLYSTYLTYLPEDMFSYKLNMNVDGRGSFTEFVKSEVSGQVSVNISKPGIIKGNHWHRTKTEKFLVVSGRGIIRFRHINSTNIIEYEVCGEKLEVVDIPPGYTHSIENTGNVDMVTVIWVNEIFDSENPDTFYMEV